MEQEKMARTNNNNEGNNERNTHDVSSRLVREKLPSFVLLLRRNKHCHNPIL